MEIYLIYLKKNIKCTREMSMGSSALRTSLRLGAWGIPLPPLCSPAHTNLLSCTIVAFIFDVKCHHLVL